MRIDVVMPTWNSNGPYFEIVIKRIVDNISINKFILVDRYSTDGTIDVVKKLIPSEKLIIIQTSADLALARAIGIKHVNTEIFAFMDSDVLLPRNLNIEKLCKILKLDKRIGALSLPLCASRKRVANMMQIGRVLKRYGEVSDPEIIKHGLFRLTSGDLFFTLLRRDAVQDWHPPHTLSALEIFSLTQHILAKGYLWIELAEPCLYHLKELRYGTGIRRYIKQGLWTGSNVHLVKIRQKHFFLEVFSRLFGGSIKSILNRDPIEALNNVFFRIGYLIGYLSETRYRVWIR